MSAAHTVIPATAKSETSLALSLAKARDSLTEVSPLLKQVRDVLDSNVLKIVMGCYGNADAAALGHTTQSHAMHIYLPWHYYMLYCLSVS